VPELPEVETIRRHLEPLLLDARVRSATAHPSAKFRPAVDAIGHRIDAVDRRGKYLLIDLSGTHELIIHLGMTGALLLADGPATGAHVRADWELDDRRHLVFDDVRRFGRLAVVPRGVYDGLPTLHHLGPEPFDPELDDHRFHRSLRASRRRVKTSLLSQRPIAGVGNIYADEALWRAGINPGARRVGPERAARLLAAIRDVLAESLENRGTTLRDYRTPDGSTGDNQRRLDCYGRGGQPCRRCGEALVARPLDQRTTTWCPNCQAR